MAALPRIAIIGAGPIGLEAALGATQHGHRVTIFEANHVAEHVRRWGHVRMFSPFGMNASQRGRAALRSAGHEPPGDGELLTGHEFALRYLFPLSRLSQLACTLQERCTVRSIARRGLLKHEQIGDPRRAARPFLLNVGGADEWYEPADVVLDCSGTFGRPNACGPGGASPLGKGSVEPGLPDLLGPARPDFAGRHTVVIGGGYSAATNVVLLAELANQDAGTRVTWLTRQAAAAPLPRIPDDALPERDRLAARANALAAGASPHVEWRPDCVVQRVEYRSSKRHHVVDVEQAATGQVSQIVCDRVLSNCGYRPDRSLYEELQIHECYASQGPMKLAAKLLGETSADCLQQTAHGPESLRNPEPDFYILGAKSYGRNSRFLLSIGLQQIEDVLEMVEG